MAELCPPAPVMARESEEFPPNTKGFVWVPGLLDRNEYASNVALVSTLEGLGYAVYIASQFDLPGVRPIEGSNNEFVCDWTPSEQFRQIRHIIDSHPEQEFTIGGFSLGGQIAALYAAADAGLGLNGVTGLVCVMPPNYYHWEGYDASRDLKWMLEQFKRNGKVDLNSTVTERRPAIPSDPNSPALTLHITKHAINSYLKPFENFPTEEGLPIAFTGLVGSGLLSRIEVPTLVVGGEFDELTPNARHMVHKIAEAIPLVTFTELPVQHDFRADNEQIRQVNGTIANWLLRQTM